MSMPRNLFLVRHGESEGNVVNKKFKETGDESLFSENFLNIHESQYNLTERGVLQATAAGQWFEKNPISFDRMLVSNNNRAMQTAAYLNLPEAQWMIDFNLRERENGLFNVLSPAQRYAGGTDQQKFHDSQSFLFRPPQGESMADVAQRIKIILDTLARECDGKDVIIVCHGHVIRTFRIILERMSLSQSNDYLTTEEEWGRVPNCAIVHYTRLNPEINSNVLDAHFNWMRIIRPAGGGPLEDQFSFIKRKKYSSQELLDEALKCNYQKT
jgi:broad specificity phosphatase PhoE